MCKRVVTPQHDSRFRGDCLLRFHHDFVPNSEAAVSVRACKHLPTDSRQLWEITIVQEMPYPGKEILKPGVCGLWPTGFLGALVILRPAVPKRKMKKIRGELCYFPLPSNIKRVFIFKAAFTRPVGILLKR